MSLAAPPISHRPMQYRWSGDDFDLASASGVFGSKRVELINGEILEMPPMNDPHAQSVSLTQYALLKPFPPDRATIRVQCPMRLGESRPLPDLVVVFATPRQLVRHPTSAALVVEVSDTTLEFDRTEKGQLYALHGLPEYWIVNINARCVEVYRQPGRSGDAGARYQELHVFGETQSVSPLSAADTVIAVSDLLP